MTPRPKFTDPEIAERIAEHLTSKVCEDWLRGEYDADTRQQILATLEVDIEFGRTDGYQLARSLEKIMDPDFELAQILDNAGYLASQEVRNAVLPWLETAELEEPRLFSMVTSTHPQAKGIGKVIRNHADGKSTVCFPELGHELKGVGTAGIVIPWEQLKPVLKRFTLVRLPSTLDFSGVEFDEETAPDWLTSKNAIPGSTADMRWFWMDHVLKLEVGQHLDTSFNRITRIA